MANSKLPIKQTVSRAELSDHNPFAIAYDEIVILIASEGGTEQEIMQILVDFYNNLKNK